jgi:hypothetical protein
MQAHQIELRLSSICDVLKVHRSGYYAWLREPLSPRAKANAKLTTQIRDFYDPNMGIYGSPRIFFDLKEAGVAFSENRVARLMRAEQIKSVRGYKRPRYKVGKPAQVVPNQLERQFQHDERPRLGHGYHLHPHALRLVVFGCRAGFALACGRWLEYGRTNADELGAGCTDDGGLAQKAKGFGDHPFGSG